MFNTHSKNNFLPTTSTPAVLIGMLLAYTSSVSATIVGSVHDLSQRGLSNEICNVCHTPHGSNTTASAPLWNHEVSTAFYTLYSSDTLFWKPEQPGLGSLSRLCLSCHDGTLAIDYFGGKSEKGDKIAKSASLGTDLSNDHPVSVRWVHQTVFRHTRGGSGDFNGGTADCTRCHYKDDFFNSPNTGKSLKFFGEKGNKWIECPTCHDVHNNQVADEKLLRVTRSGSKICFYCHIHMG